MAKRLHQRILLSREQSGKDKPIFPIRVANQGSQTYQSGSLYNDVMTLLSERAAHQRVVFFNNVDVDAVKVSQKSSQTLFERCLSMAFSNLNFLSKRRQERNIYLVNVYE